MRRLSSQDLEDIVRMFRTGAPADEIGRVYGLTARAIRYRLAARGLRYPRVGGAGWQAFVEARRAEIHALRGKGLALPAMAHALGLGIRALRKWMGRWMPALYAQLRAEVAAARQRSRPDGPRWRRVRPAERQKMVALYQEGHAMAAIARHLGRSLSVVGRVIAAAGVPTRAQRGRSPMWLRAMRERRQGEGMP